MRRLTFHELQLETNRLANALRQLGSSAETASGVHADAAGNGGRGSRSRQAGRHLFADVLRFGPEALGSRLHDGEASLLITVDGALRRGKPSP